MKDKIIISIAIDDDRDIDQLYGVGTTVTEAIADLASRDILDKFSDPVYRKEEGIDEWDTDQKLDNIICTMEKILVIDMLTSKITQMPAYYWENKEVFRPNNFKELVNYITGKIK